MVPAPHPGQHSLLELDPLVPEMQELMLISPKSPHSVVKMQSVNIGERFGSVLLTGSATFLCHKLMKVMFDHVFTMSLPQKLERE